MARRTVLCLAVGGTADTAGAAPPSLVEAAEQATTAQRAGAARQGADVNATAERWHDGAALGGVSR